MVLLLGQHTTIGDVAMFAHLCPCCKGQSLSLAYSLTLGRPAEAPKYSVEAMMLFCSARLGPSHKLRVQH